MTKYRFVNVQCPNDANGVREQICTDPDSGEKYCSYEQTCGANKNSLDSAKQVLQTNVGNNDAADGNSASFVEAEAGGAINDGTDTFKQVNSYFKPRMTLRGAETVRVKQSINPTAYQACTAAPATICDPGAVATFVEEGDGNARVVACFRESGVEEPRSFQVAGLQYCKTKLGEWERGGRPRALGWHPESLALHLAFCCPPDPPPPTPRPPPPPPCRHKQARHLHHLLRCAVRCGHGTGMGRRGPAGVCPAYRHCGAGLRA